MECKNWIVGPPRVYVMAQFGKNFYETWLSIATLPGKYFLFSYLGLNDFDPQALSTKTTEIKIQDELRRVYSETGMGLAYLPTSQNDFGECVLVNNENCVLDFQMNDLAKRGCLRLTNFDKSLDRLVPNMVDEDFDKVIKLCQKRDSIKVTWNDSPALELGFPSPSIEFKNAIWA